MGPSGESGDWKFDLSSHTTDHAWIGSSYFFYGNLQFSNDTELMTEDVNPAPSWGGRGVQWKKHPSTDDKKGKIHWWCEGYANEMGREGTEIGLSDGRTIRADAGHVFRIFMTCFAYEPYFLDN